jgi:hypothetical protein
VEPEVVDRFRSSLKSMSSHELLELVDTISYHILYCICCSSVVEPEVVDRFRSSLKSMSSHELRELVDSPTSVRSGHLMASLIKEHKRVLSDKINKIRNGCSIFPSKLKHFCINKEYRQLWMHRIPGRPDILPDNATSIIRPDIRPFC